MNFDIYIYIAPICGCPRCQCAASIWFGFEFGISEPIGSQMLSGWWFQTWIFMFHNIWDNPSHWNHQPVVYVFNNVQSNIEILNSYTEASEMMILINLDHSHWIKVKANKLGLSQKVQNGASSLSLSKWIWMAFCGAIPHVQTPH